MEREDRECAQLLLEAGASQAVPSANHDAQENIYFVGHQNTPERQQSTTWFPRTTRTQNG